MIVLERVSLKIRCNKLFSLRFDSSFQPTAKQKLFRTHPIVCMFVVFERQSTECQAHNMRADNVHFKRQVVTVWKVTICKLAHSLAGTRKILSTALYRIESTVTIFE